MGAAKPKQGFKQTKISRKAHIEQARKRLLGTWRSDKKRTMKEWVFKKRASAKSRRVINGTFGKLTWRITRKRIYVNSRDRSSIFNYKILWANEWSLILHLKHADYERCYHLHFDDPFFYIPVVRHNSEYFRKVAA